MPNVTYLFGAGASREAVPLVAEIPRRLLEFIDQLILVISSAALMTYALYTFSAENLPKSHSMMLTIPVVLYGLFRYLFLIREGNVGGAPEELLFRDRPLLFSVVVWAALAVGILYLSR